MCKKSGVGYIPSGWIGKPGHFAGMKLRSLGAGEGHYALSVINHGAGINKYHHKATNSGTKDKFIYQSDEYEIDLLSDVGHEFLKRYLELQFGLPESKVNKTSKVRDYADDDLYGLLKLCGSEILLTDKPRENKLSEKSVTPQRGGTCTVTNLHAMARDILIDRYANLKERKRYHFVIKLRSIINAFNDYKIDKCPCNVLEWALREFSVRINKEYRHTLSDAEMIYCGQLQAEIHQRLEGDKKASIQEKCVSKPFPAIMTDARPHKEDLLSGVSEKSTVNIERGGSKAAKKTTFIFIKPEDVMATMHSALLQEEVNVEIDLKKYYDLFNALPYCSGEEQDSFWDSVPLRDISYIVQLLVKIINKSPKEGEAKGQLGKGRVFAVALMAYDIAAQLAPRINLSKTQSDPFNLGAQYAFGLDDIYTEQTFYYDPNVYHTVKRIAENFEKRTRGKERVLTNAVNYQNNKHDSTVFYIIQVVLSFDKRELIKYSFNKQRQSSHKDLSDLKLFEHLMENITQQKPELLNVLPGDVLMLIRLSATAHNLGVPLETYGKYGNEDLYLFNCNRFHKEVRRSRELDNWRNQTVKNLPDRKKMTKSNLHQGFSENTNHHPLLHLENLQKQLRQKVSGTANKYEHSPQISLHAYQVYESGSISADSALWKLDNVNDNHRQIVRMWDEEFRQIESAPNLQVARLLSWARINLHSLTVPAVSARMFSLLFHYGKLDNAFVNHLETTVLSINRFFSAILSYCQGVSPCNPSLLIMASTLANLLRYHLEVTAKVYGFTIEQYSFPSFRDVLWQRVEDSIEGENRSRLANALIESFYNSGVLLARDCCLLLFSRIFVNLGDDAIASNESWNELNPVLIKVIQQRLLDITPILNRFVSEWLGLKSSAKWHLKDCRLIAIDSDFMIDLEVGSLQMNGENKLKERTEKTIADNKELFDLLDLTDSSITLLYADDGSENKVLISSDNRWIFYCTAAAQDSAVKFTVKNVEQLLSIESKKVRFKMIMAKPGKENIWRLDDFKQSEKYPRRYVFWQSIADDGLFFLRQLNSEYAYVYPACGGYINNNISQLEVNTEGEWRRNDKLLLDLANATSFSSLRTFEFEWVKRLEPLFGINNLRCIAVSNGGQLTLQRIEHLSLGLNFTVNAAQQLMCDEEPGYFLSEEMGLEVLHGMPSVIILQNKSGKEKYLLPAFLLNIGEKNNSCNQDNIVNTSSICNVSQPLYTLSFNQHQQLEAASVNANLYLAIVYRSLGDFKRAFHYLTLCQSPENIMASTVTIAMQVLERKISSPLGAAFDLKLAVYLKEHQSKWSKDDKQRFEQVEFPTSWREWIDSQLHRYNNAFSHYKTGVAILPDYCRLTEAEFALVKKQNELTLTVVRETNKRITQASRLAIISGKHVFVEHCVWESRMIDFEKCLKDKLKDVPDQLTTLRLYIDSISRPALYYLVANFAALFKDAVSKDESRITLLNIKLFSLLQNDADQSDELPFLIAVLKFSSICPDCFDCQSLLQLNNFDLMKRLVTILHKNSKTLEDVRLPLFDTKNPSALMVIKNPLENDHAAEAVVFVLPFIEREQECKRPLSVFCSKYFTPSNVPTAKEPFGLDLSAMPNATFLEKKLLEKLKKGHEENQEKMKVHYQLKDENNEREGISGLRDKLKNTQQDDQQLVNTLKAALIALANKSPTTDQLNSVRAKASNFQASQISEQRNNISISDLLTSLLQQNPLLLTENNPFLTQEDISKLYADLASYLLLNSRIDQSNEALDILGEHTSFSQLVPYQLQLLAITLDKSRSYTVKDFPEFLVYEYASKRLLRKDQVDVLKKIIDLIENDPENTTEMHHCLLQFAAGGGKSSVIIPILAHRFARKGFLPVIINTNELYDLGLKDIPINLRNSFQQNLEVIDRGIDHEWTKGELVRLLKDLGQWRQAGKCVLLKAVTWHAINLARKVGINDDDLSKAAEEVLNFFKTKCVKLEDECQLVSDPLQQSIKTFGEMQSIPSAQLELLLACYDELMGNAQDKTIANLAGIQSKRKRAITPDELVHLQQLLAFRVANRLGLDEVFHNDIVNFLLQVDRAKPDWLKNLYNKQFSKSKTQVKLPQLPDEQARSNAELIILARAFIQTHLPHILLLQDKKDYGESIHPGDLTVAPKHEGKDVTSHFGDHTLVAALTIQMYQQRGLSFVQVKQLIGKLREEHINERKWNANFDVPTCAEIILMKWIPEDYTFGSYQELTTDLILQLSQDPQFFRHPELINKYLTVFALPQIKVPMERQLSTAAELQAGFLRSVMLSATPSLPELYPVFLKPENCFLEEAFEAQVIDVLLNMKNRGLCKLQTIQQPSEFFEQFPPELLMKMTTLIDRGALLTDFTAQDVLKSYLGLDKDKVTTQTGVFFSKNQMHLRTKAADVKEANISGAGLVSALKKQGIKPEEFLLFLFLDLSKTTGTDVKRPYNDHAGLTVGKGQTITETIQAAMRERQLLDDDAQTITWIMFQSLYQQICPDAPEDSFDLRQLFYWMIRNEAKEIEIKLINRAYQGIDQIIMSAAWEKISGGHIDLIANVRIFQDLSPWHNYEIESCEQDASSVLGDYVNKLLDRLNNGVSDEAYIQLSVEGTTLIDKIIADTSALISKLQSPPKVALNNEVLQEMQIEQMQQQEIQQEKRMKNTFDKVQSFVFAVEEYSPVKDSLEAMFEFFTKTKQQRWREQHYKQLQLPNCQDIVHPALFFCQQHFAVFKQAASKASTSNLEQLKPIKILLVKVTPENDMKYLACTAAGAEYYSCQLNNNKFSVNDPAYVMLTIDGDILCISDNISQSKYIEMIATVECQQMMTYAHFLNGKINNVISLSEIIKAQHWTQQNYVDLANAIASVHVSQSPVSLLENAALEKACGWESKQSQHTSAEIVSKRYCKPTESITSIKQRQSLNPISPNKALSIVTKPISKPGRALEGYVFGKLPEPIPTRVESPRLALPQSSGLFSFLKARPVISKDAAMNASGNRRLQT
jgi:hypothetical protein